jgi:hypothetical protein
MVMSFEMYQLGVTKLRVDFFGRSNSGTIDSEGHKIHP